MNLPMFYRGFLYALREQMSDDDAPKFEADGDHFHEAFRQALEYAAGAVPEVPVSQILDNFDPMFGVSPEATEMLLEGERDFILSLLNPRLQVAQFKISRETAREALEHIPAHDGFRKIAQHFHERLAAH